MIFLNRVLVLWLAVLSCGCMSGSVQNVQIGLAPGASGADSPGQLASLLKSADVLVEDSYC